MNIKVFRSLKFVSFLCVGILLATRAFAKPNCEEDMDCFIQAAKSCEPTMVMFSASSERFGLLHAVTSELRIKGMKQDLCQYQSEVVSSDVKLTKEMREHVKAQGVPDSEIEAEEKRSKEHARKLIGAGMACEFETEKLVTMLTNIKEGRGNEPDRADCRFIPSKLM